MNDWVKLLFPTVIAVLLPIFAFVYGYGKLDEKNSATDRKVEKLEQRSLRDIDQIKHDLDEIKSDIKQILRDGN